MTARNEDGKSDRSQEVDDTVPAAEAGPQPARKKLRTAGIVVIVFASLDRLWPCRAVVHRTRFSAVSTRVGYRGRRGCANAGRSASGHRSCCVTGLQPRALDSSLSVIIFVPFELVLNHYRYGNELCHCQNQYLVVPVSTVIRVRLIASLIASSNTVKPGSQSACQTLQPCVLLMAGRACVRLADKQKVGCKRWWSDAERNGMSRSSIDVECEQ